MNRNTHTKKKYSSSRLSRNNRRVHTHKKALVCSPLVKHKRINNNTCLTENMLVLIKNEYNKLHPSNKIMAQSNRAIWYELQKKMQSSMDKKYTNFDNFWYSHIRNKSLKKKIADYIFAPKHPESWNKNPNEWLSNHDILKVLRQYEITYSYFKFFEPTTIDFDTHLAKGECVSDELCKMDIMEYIKNGKTEFGFIFNLDKHTGSGTHWVSFYFSYTHSFAFFFDSVGESIPKDIMRLKNRIFKQIKEHNTNAHLYFYQNAPYEHQKGNNECGMYSLYFIQTMLTQKINDERVSFKTLIKYFKGKSKYGRITDNQMNMTRKELFNSPDAL